VTLTFAIALLAEGREKQRQLPNVNSFTDRQAGRERSEMPETKLTGRQLEKIKEIHETLKESGDLLDKTTDAWHAIMELGWIVDDLTGVGVRTWAR
jgi:hypothetical protein